MDLSVMEERLKKLDKLKIFLQEINSKLLSLTKDLNWDYNKLIEEGPSNMVTCSINSQHRVPTSTIKSHERTCQQNKEEYQKYDKPFSDHSGQGSYITLNAEMLNQITSHVSSTCANRAFRPVPNTSANLDQDFSREEKLAIYDYVIANTQKQKSFSDLCLQSFETKKEEKKELSAWEIAAAERDAKRRRASYRNKVHTNCKTHTEILREVIDVQMEILKEEVASTSINTEKKHEKHKHSYKKSNYDSRMSDGKKYSSHESRHRRDKEDRRKERKRDRQFNYRSRTHNYSPMDTSGDSISKSRSHEKHRKWNTLDGRSHSRK